MDRNIFEAAAKDFHEKSGQLNKGQDNKGKLKKQETKESLAKQNDSEIDAMIEKMQQMLQELQGNFAHLQEAGKARNINVDELMKNNLFITDAEVAKLNHDKQAVIEASLKLAKKVPSESQSQAPITGKKVRQLGARKKNWIPMP